MNDTEVRWYLDVCEESTVEVHRQVGSWTASMGRWMPVRPVASDEATWRAVCALDPVWPDYQPVIALDQARTLFIFPEEREHGNRIV